MSCCICFENINGLALPCKKPCEMLCCGICWLQVQNKDNCPLCRRKIEEYKPIRSYKIAIIGFFIILFLLNFRSSFPLEFVEECLISKPKDIFVFYCEDFSLVCSKFNCYKQFINVENEKCFNNFECRNYPVLNIGFFYHVIIFIILCGSIGSLEAKYVPNFISIRNNLE